MSDDKLFVEIWRTRRDFVVAGVGAFSPRGRARGTLGRVVADAEAVCRSRVLELVESYRRRRLAQ